jgi:prophage regulatory protein
MRYLSYRDLNERGIPYHEVHIRRLVKAGRFPRPVAIGPGRVGFVEDEVDDWMRQRVAERDAAATVAHKAEGADVPSAA